ncbi:acyltransferase family protein [Bacteroidota bacterium]
MLARIFDSTGRVIGLDIVRAIAIFYVFWGHGQLLIPAELHQLYSLPTIIPIDGVGLFFVLSGFLIGNILIRTISTTEFNFRDLLNFWLRRWFRTLPAYFAVLLFLIWIYFKYWNYDWRFFVFSQNVITDHPHFFHVAWSLSVEEWFYLTFPLVLFGLARFTKDHMTSLTASLALFLIVPFLLRVYHGFGDSALSLLSTKSAVIFRLDSMMYGVAAAAIYYHWRSLWDKYARVALLIGVCLLTLDLLYSWFLADNDALKVYYEIFKYSVQAVSYALLLPFFSNLKTLNSKIVTRAVVAVSKLSYSFYLMHASVVLWLIIQMIQQTQFIKGLRFEFQWMLLFVLYGIISLVLSVVLYQLVEVPFLNLRKRVTKKV